jgi:hypothetical protein
VQSTAKYNRRARAWRPHNRKALTDQTLDTRCWDSFQSVRRCRSRALRCSRRAGSLGLRVVEERKNGPPRISRGHDHPASPLPSQMC